VGCRLTTWTGRDTLLGLSRAARPGGLIPAWQEKLGLGAAAGFFIASVASIPGLEGSPIGLPRFVALVIWLPWLAMTGVRLLREDVAAA
jgi:hypothetical protein